MMKLALFVLLLSARASALQLSTRRAIVGAAIPASLFVSRAAVAALPGRQAPQTLAQIQAEAKLKPAPSTSKPLETLIANSIRNKEELMGRELSDEEKEELAVSIALRRNTRTNQPTRALHQPHGQASARRALTCTRQCTHTATRRSGLP